MPSRGHYYEWRRHWVHENSAPPPFAKMIPHVREKNARYASKMEREKTKAATAISESEDKVAAAEAQVAKGGVGAAAAREQAARARAEGAAEKQFLKTLLGVPPDSKRQPKRAGQPPNLSVPLTRPESPPKGSRSAMDDPMRRKNPSSKCSAVLRPAPPQVLSAWVESDISPERRAAEHNMGRLMKSTGPTTTEIFFEPEEVVAARHAEEQPPAQSDDSRPKEKYDPRELERACIEAAEEKFGRGRLSKLELEAAMLRALELQPLGNPILYPLDRSAQTVDPYLQLPAEGEDFGEFEFRVPDPHRVPKRRLDYELKYGHVANMSDECTTALARARQLPGHAPLEVYHGCAYGTRILPAYDPNAVGGQRPCAGTLFRLHDRAVEEATLNVTEKARGRPGAPFVGRDDLAAGDAAPKNSEEVRRRELLAAPGRDVSPEARRGLEDALERHEIRVPVEAPPEEEPEERPTIIELRPQDKASRSKGQRGSYTTDTQRRLSKERGPSPGTLEALYAQQDQEKAYTDAALTHMGAHSFVGLPRTLTENMAGTSPSPSPARRRGNEDEEEGPDRRACSPFEPGSAHRRRYLAQQQLIKMELETQIGPPSPHQKYRNPYFFEQGPPPPDGRQARIRSKSEYEAYKAENKGKPGDASNFGRAERMQKLLAARKVKQDQAKRKMKLSESTGELSGRAKGEGPPVAEDALGGPNLHPSLRGLAFTRGNPPRESTLRTDDYHVKHPEEAFGYELAKHQKHEDWMAHIPKRGAHAEGSPAAVAAEKKAAEDEAAEYDKWRSSFVKPRDFGTPKRKRSSAKSKSGDEAERAAEKLAEEPPPAAEAPEEEELEEARAAWSPEVESALFILSQMQQRKAAQAAARAQNEKVLAAAERRAQHMSKYAPGFARKQKEAGSGPSSPRSPSPGEGADYNVQEAERERGKYERERAASASPRHAGGWKGARKDEPHKALHAQTAVQLQSSPKKRTVGIGFESATRGTGRVASPKRAMLGTADVPPRPASPPSPKFLRHDRPPPPAPMGNDRPIEERFRGFMQDRAAFTEHFSNQKSGFGLGVTRGEELLRQDRGEG